MCVVYFMSNIYSKYGDNPQYEYLKKKPNFSCR